jgi:hydrogenase nickel incorporation protein HypA/HybF
MHELSIAFNLVELAAAAARRAGATRITAIYLRLGALAGVVPEALQFSFPLAAADTLAAGADLVIELVPVQVFCPTCAALRDLEAPFILQCPECGAPTPHLIQGRELELRAVEIIALDEQVPKTNEQEPAHAAAHP